MPRIIRTPQANEDIFGVWDYIAADNITAADKLVRTIDERLQLIARQPRMSVREILEQAIDFAWHVQMSGELDRRPEPPDGRAEQIPEPPNRYNGWKNFGIVGRIYGCNLERVVLWAWVF